jgi:hypothetical protein
MEREFPRFRIAVKAESRLHAAIGAVLRVVTLGAMNDYVSGYHTVIGQTVYVAAGWEKASPETRVITLRHERVHMRQFRRFTPVGMAVLYLLVPLPIGLAYFRYRFEAEAYAESIRATREAYGLPHVESTAYRERIVGHFTGAGYGWMWPFRRAIERWYDGVLATCRD